MERAQGRSPEPRPRAPRRLLAFGRIPPREDAWFQLRLPIPPEIVRRVELGLDGEAAGQEDEAWWRCVEERMQRFVQGRLPEAARDVDLQLDEEALEVIARFRWAG